MKTYTTVKKNSVAQPRHHRINSRKPLSEIALSLNKPPNITPLQRQSPCACGGGCSKCQAKELGLQPKLTIGAPNDKYEQEADRVADQVMRMPDAKVQRRAFSEEQPERLQAKPLANQVTPLLQRQAEDADEEEMLQAKQDSDISTHAKPGLDTQLSALRGGGKPLSSADRGFFEPRFGYNFSQVRVHTDARAAEAARSANALAFTVGRDVVFGAGQYSTGIDGKRLLAHELTHVVQQQGVDRNIQRQEGKTKKSKVLSRSYSAFIAEKSVVYETSLSGIEIRIYTKRDSDTEQLLAADKNLSKVVAEIIRVNGLIQNKDGKISQLYIANGAGAGAGAFRIALGQPTVLMELSIIADGTIALPTASHEASHGIIQDMRINGFKKYGNTLTKIADLYTKLGDTDTLEIDISANFDSDGGSAVDDLFGIEVKSSPLTHHVPTGQFMVDPSNWSGEKNREHPYENFDEFFATAMSSYLLNKKALKKSIKKYSDTTKYPKNGQVAALGAELLQLLKNVSKGKTETYTIEDQIKAEEAIDEAPTAPVYEKSVAGGFIQKGDPKSSGPGKEDSPIKESSLLYLLSPTSMPDYQSKTTSDSKAIY